MKKHQMVVLLGGIFLFLGAGSVWARGSVRIDEDKLYRVVETIDGDTIVADIGGRGAIVRMLGVDTPETVDPRKTLQCYGSEASNRTKELLYGRKVRLVSNPKREGKDRYGRHLMYVYRDDGLFVNEELLKGGFAREYTFGKPYSLQARFRALEKGARAAGAGLWDSCGGSI